MAPPRPAPTLTELSQNATEGMVLPRHRSAPGVGAQSRLHSGNSAAIQRLQLAMLRLVRNAFTYWLRTDRCAPPEDCIVEPACPDDRATFCRAAPVAPRRTGRHATSFEPAALEPLRNAFTHRMRTDGHAPPGLRRYPTPGLIAGTSATDPDLIRAAPHEQYEISSSLGSVCT